MKDKFKKLISIISIVALIFSNPATLIYAKALDSGDVIRESVETGSLVNEGDIHIKKTATATETPGRYKITFEIEGVPYQKTYPLHAVVVFDRSGSMICSNGGARQTNSNPHYTAADGIGVSCASREYYDLWGNLHREWDANLRTKEKWENAISGAQTFQSTIKANLGDSANVSLVTFSDNADTATNSFTDADFKHPLGTTNLADAITTAKNKLDSETAGVSNAKKVILVISDGNPNDTSAATRAASSAKTNSDIEIYAIGYATTTTTSNYLKNNIASPGAKHYSDANPATITAAVEDMVNDLVAAAVDPTLTDTLTPEFKIEGAEEFAGTKTFTLENITGEKQTVSFYVDIDQTKPTGYYDTNNTTDKKAGITYTDPKTGETKTLMLDESPNVYWERPQVAYTVNHYKDRIDSNNKVEPSDTGVADYSTNIPYIARTDIKGYVFDHLEDKNGNVVENVAITKNAADNVLNVIYTKKENLEYTVVYHYEDLKGEFTETINDSGNPHTATFGDTINVEEYKATGLAKKPEGAFVYNSHQLTNPTIDDETENRLDIFYTREEYPYCVNYFYDGTEDSSLKDTGTKKYGDTLTYQDKNKTGYKFLEVTPSESITITVDDKTTPTKNVINVYYVKDDFGYTVNYYYDDGTSTNKIGDTVEGEAEYDSTVTLTEEELMDRVPTGYKLQDNQEDSIKITEDKTKNNLDVIYVKDNFEYTVNHYKDSLSGEKIEPSETGEAEYDSSIPYTKRTVKGYVFDHLENKNGETVTSLSVTEKNEDNVLNVIYKKKTGLDYTVVYHYEDLNGEFTETINDDGNPHDATFGDTINVETYKATGLAKKPEGAFVYNSHQLTNPTIDDETENRLDIFYTREEYPYCVNYFYDGTEDSSLKDTGTKKYGDTLTYQDKNKTGYKFLEVTPSESITITVDDKTTPTKNVINVYYVKDDFGYTVNYYYDDGTSTNKIGDTVEGEAEYDSTVTLTEEELMDRVPTGYKLQDNQEDSIKITEDKTKNNLDVIYVKDNFEYTVNYYKDSKSEDNKLGDTVEDEAEYDSTVTLTEEELMDRVPTGYKLQDNQEDSIKITEDKTKNNLDVIYVKDNFEYTVNYYYNDGKSTNKIGDTVEDEAEFDSTVTLTEEELMDRVPEGYRLQDNQEDSIKITEDKTKNNLDVIYVKDNFEYTVNYYYNDGKSTNKIGDTVEDEAEFDSTVTLTEEELMDRVPEGYRLQDNQADSIKITEDKTKNNLDVIYVKRDDLTYTVEYYYDGKLDEDATVTYVNQTFGDEITSYVDKAKEGYELDKVENLPLTISVDEEKNVIKVYYVNTAKDQPIEIPNTGLNEESGSTAGLIVTMLYLVGLSIFLSKRKGFNY